MSTAAERIGRNLAAIGARIAAAAVRAGRDPAGVELLVVTKTVDAETTAALLDCGITAIGENRVQDALAKAEALGDVAGRFRWHLLGHLQTNKAKKALGLFGAMHSLDSVRLAEALEKELSRAASSSLATRDPQPARAFPVFVEVNTSGDASKTGASKAEVRAIFEKLKSCPHLQPAGLMTMGPLDGGPEAARPCFRQLREMLGALRAEGLAPEGCTGLSMGMTGDFEVAVEEGATIVRIGTAVFA
ncbi:MAG TPA: YggS family pyridoxal phosphate-dependent enzyme [Planctomycetota bacterium]|nr:YggS family pyridoxal phosphate-dependent enzyme [Planctomycetota bacterium]